MLLVVGGQRRKVGKTAVVAGLISALREARWTAVKIAGHAHGDASTRTGATKLVEHGEGYALWRQVTADETDTGRYLASGAHQAYLLETEPVALARAVPLLRRILQENQYTIIESSSVVEFLEPDLFLMVADPGSSDVKGSSRRSRERADAFVVTRSERRAREPGGMFPGALATRPCFEAPGPGVPDSLAEFVRQRMRLKRPETRP